MKEKDIHQEYEPQQLIMYVEKEDGTYGPIQTGSYLSKNFLDDFWLKRMNLEKKLANQLVNNDISPIYYYMVLSELSVAELASRVGMHVFRVKRHLKAKHFSKISLSTLARYAHVFDVPLSNLLQIILFQDGDDLKSFYIKDKAPELFEIIQNATKNPHVAITTIKKKI
ncbi:MAG: helix-turn-helix transcriptional regulator [Bacteroidales bacterium]|nr:helix-turn-helix transcriptional regulator [Bacteroidales bacterium]